MAPFFGFAFLEHENRMPNYKTRMVLAQGTCVHDFERFTRGNDPKLAVSKWDCIMHFVAETKGFVRIKTSHAVSQDPEANKEFMFACSIPDENSFSSSNTFDDASMYEDIVQHSSRCGPSESGYLIDDYITQRSPSRGYNSSRSTENESDNGDDDPHVATIEKFTIQHKFFANFDRDTKTLLKFDHLNRKFAEKLDKHDHIIVCMICEEHIDDNKAEIVEHLERCTGIAFELPSEEHDDILPMYKMEK